MGILEKWKNTGSMTSQILIRHFELKGKGKKGFFQSILFFLLLSLEFFCLFCGFL